MRLEHALTGSVLSAVSRGRDVLDEQTGLVVPESSLSQSQNLCLESLTALTGTSISMHLFCMQRWPHMRQSLFMY